MVGKTPWGWQLDWVLASPSGLPKGSLSHHPWLASLAFTLPQPIMEDRTQYWCSIVVPVWVAVVLWSPSSSSAPHSGSHYEPRSLFDLIPCSCLDANIFPWPRSYSLLLQNFWNQEQCFLPPSLGHILGFLAQHSNRMVSPHSKQRGALNNSGLCITSRCHHRSQGKRNTEHFGKKQK